VIFHVQHHWVTESGDNIYLDPAVATTVPVQNSQTRFAIISYPSHITGGTGRFAGAAGDVTYFGEADLVSGTALRYSGQVCFLGTELTASRGRVHMGFSQHAPQRWLAERAEWLLKGS